MVSSLPGWLEEWEEQTQEVGMICLGLVLARGLLHKVSHTSQAWEHLGVLVCQMVVRMVPLALRAVEAVWEEGEDH